MGFSKAEWAQCLDQAHQLAHKIMKQMDKDGALPDNPVAREAMRSAIELLSSELSTKDKLAVIRTLLEYNMAKPAATTNLNVKTAEDFLDELAEEDVPGG